MSGWVVLLRWVGRATGPALVAWLVPRMTLLLLLAAQIDAMFPLARMAVAIRELPPWTAAAAFATTVVLTGAEQRAAVLDLLLGERHALLRRQPLTGAAFGPAAAAVLAPLGLPVAGIGLLWGGHPAVSALWLALWLAPGVLAARPVALVATAVALSPIVAVAHAVPELAAPLAGCAVIAALPIAGALTLRLGTGPVRHPAPIRMRPRTVLGGLVHRDLIVAWRADPVLVRLSLAVGLLGVPVAAMQRVGAWDASALTAGAIVLLSFAAPLALALPAAVARRLGHRLDPPEWPVASFHRAVSLAVLGALAVVPGWASAAVGAPHIGALGHVRIAVFVGALGAGAAWWIADRPGSPNPGTWLWWIGACAAGAMIPGALWATLALALFALWRATARLEIARWKP